MGRGLRKYRCLGASQALNQISTPRRIPEKDLKFLDVSKSAEHIEAIMN